MEQSNIMNPAENYIKVNRENWDKRVGIHLQSDFYRMESFLKGENMLKPLDIDLLGNIEGKSILHLQCHFGQDTISLSHMGAKATGVDFSSAAITKAREYAKQLGVDTQFIEANVLELQRVIGEQYDIVFTSYGTISWFPDLQPWAEGIAHSLKPGGQFIFAEFHPVIWMYEDNFDRIEYAYAASGPIVESEAGTYADRSITDKMTSVCWNHGLAEIFNALKSAGIQVVDFGEYNYAHENFTGYLKEYENGVYRIEKFEDKIPLVFSMRGVKK